MKNSISLLVFVFVFKAVSLFALNQAYVTNSGDSSVSVIDTISGNTITTISPVGSTPQGIVLSPDGSRAYVASSGDGTVVAIDTSTNTVLPTSYAVGGSPRGIAITPDGNFLYVANEGSMNVNVINLSSGSISNITGLGDTPWHVAISPDGSRAYVTVINDSDLAVIDIATSGVTLLGLASSSDPTDVAVTPDGSYVYVTATGEGEVDRIDTTTFVVNEEGVNNSPNGVAISLDGALAYVISSDATQRFNVIDVASNTLLTVTNFPNISPTTVGMTPNGDFAFVPDNSGSALHLFDLGTNAYLGTISVGSNPYQVAVVPALLGLRGASKKEQFLTETNIFNELKWNTPDNITTLRYKIYRDEVLIATLGPGELSFRDNNRKRKQVHSYLVVAEGPGGSGGVGRVTLKTPG